VARKVGILPLDFSKLGPSVHVERDQIQNMNGPNGAYGANENGSYAGWRFNFGLLSGRMTGYRSRVGYWLGPAGRRRYRNEVGVVRIGRAPGKGPGCKAAELRGAGDGCGRIRFRLCSTSLTRSTARCFARHRASSSEVVRRRTLDGA
jgi:hypothetical protein